MDKPMNEYAADAPRVLRDFLTYISTIRGKSAKTAHEYYLDLRLFFRVLKHNKGAVDKNLPLDEIDISSSGRFLSTAPLLKSTSATLIWILSVISRCRTPMIIWNTWRRAAQLSRTATTPITD